MKKRSLFGLMLFLAAALIWPVSCAQGRLGDRLFGRTSEPEATNAAPAEEDQGVAEAETGPGSTEVDLQHDSIDRYYIVHVPSKLDKGKPAPLVLNLHGGGGNPAQQERDTEMDAVADANGFVVVYPAGTNKWKKRWLSWNIGMSDTYATSHNVDDIGFLRAVIADVSKSHSIDQKRIYVTGFSQGGMMCYRVACEMSDVVAAVAPVSGVMQVAKSDCKPKRAMPIIHFHGLEDPNVAYNGGIGPKAHDKIPRPSVDETIQFWVKQDGLSDKPEKESKTGKAELKQYGPGKGGAEIVLWTLDDGGHAWPGGKEMLPEWKVGKVNMDINASQLMWKFFADKKLE